MSDYSFVYWEISASANLEFFDTYSQFYLSKEAASSLDISRIENPPRKEIRKIWCFNIRIKEDTTQYFSKLVMARKT